MALFGLCVWLLLLFGEVGAISYPVLCISDLSLFHFEFDFLFPDAPTEPTSSTWHNGGLWSRRHLQDGDVSSSSALVFQHAIRRNISQSHILANLSTLLFPFSIVLPVGLRSMLRFVLNSSCTTESPCIAPRSRLHCGRSIRHAAILLLLSNVLVTMSGQFSHMMCWWVIYDMDWRFKK